MEVASKIASVIHGVDPLRHLKAGDHERAAGAFGSGGFGAAAEKAARFFGTPGYIVGQTIVVALWIAINTGVLLNLVHFDRYPYILLNLAFSLQAAYAAPLILLAQTRQADRDKIHAEADAQHREQIAQEQIRRSAEIKTLLDQNTELTKKVDYITSEIHRATCAPPQTN
ncbi:MAG TPA: DUF1003 domain-containing protein [Gaiellaceae bacterium]|nr:DUF1003 domain-containing protein [Gaiellaceae bacterium]